MTKEQMAIRFIRNDYKSAVKAAESAAIWLSRDTKERVPGEAFTPGNIAASAGKLEAALEKAYALREALRALGEQP